MDADRMALTAAAQASLSTPLERVNALLAACAALQASDLHLSPGLPPHVRVEAELNPLPGAVALSAEDTDAIARTVVNAHAATHESFEIRLERKGSIDGAMTSPDGVRFRFNLFVRQKQIGVIFRRLENRFRTLKELGLPESIYNLCDMRDGLVIVSGPTGSGKSTTLAALLDRINRTRTGHVVTIEDPIEYVHKPVRCVISHRQVGIDAPTFNDALVASLRQDPDVILLGEVRDIETFRTAITAAETGHLVFATLHAGDTVSSVERFTSIFPAAEQDSIRRQLALVLRAVVAQHLLPAIPCDGKRVERVVASEVLIVNNAVANLIVQGKSGQIVSMMETGQSSGMQLLDQDLARLWVEGRINEAAALACARNPLGMRDRATLLRKRSRPMMEVGR